MPGAPCTPGSASTAAPGRHRQGPATRNRPDFVAISGYEQNVDGTVIGLYARDNAEHHRPEDRGSTLPRGSDHPGMTRIWPEQPLSRERQYQSREERTPHRVRVHRPPASRPTTRARDMVWPLPAAPSPPQPPPRPRAVRWPAAGLIVRSSSSKVRSCHATDSHHLHPATGTGDCRPPRRTRPAQPRDRPGRARRRHARCLDAGSDRRVAARRRAPRNGTPQHGYRQSTQPGAGTPLLHRQQDPRRQHPGPAHSHRAAGRSRRAEGPHLRRQHPRGLREVSRRGRSPKGHPAHPGCRRPARGRRPRARLGTKTQVGHVQRTLLKAIRIAKLDVPGRSRRAEGEAARRHQHGRDQELPGEVPAQANRRARPADPAAGWRPSPPAGPEPKPLLKVAGCPGASPRSRAICGST